MKRGKIMNMDEIICNCNSVTAGMIRDAVQSGAATLEEVQDTTGAGTVCGACTSHIQHLIKEFSKEKQ